MTKKPTLDQFKTWSAQAFPVAKALLLARLVAEHERARVDGYIMPVFRSFSFRYAERWHELHTGPITDPKDLYLCDDKETLDDYYAACDRAHRAHGFTGPAGYCPALVAENNVTRAERLLIDVARPLFGIEDVYGDNRTQYLELLIGACCQASDEQAVGYGR